MNLSTPIEQLSKIGPQYQKKLKKLKIKTVQDLIFHFPHRYENFSNITTIAEIKTGEINSIQGKILKIENKRTWRKRMTITETLVQDKSGIIKIIWFNQPYLINTLKPGDFVCLSGKATLKKNNDIYLSSPSYEKIIYQQTQELTHTGRLIPVYPETEKLSSKWLRFILKPLLTKLKKEILDPLPEKIIQTHKLLPLQTAIWQIHFPDSIDLAKKAKQRFQFEELFLIMLLVFKKRQKVAQEKAKAIPLNLEIIKSFISTLPFKLTDSQKKATWQILKDLEKPKPMNRLLEGDVGSGKTVVATISILNVIKTGYQTTLMAPTEILAKQHFQEISKLLSLNKINIGLLTGKESKIIFKKLENEIVKISKKKFLEEIKKGEIDLLIGTHALIQESVIFNKLALVILDEQHRFGVDQRAKLTQKQKFLPHFLSMTATPIPRTLSLTIYGDLDLSLITEMPKGRKKIITKIIPPQMRLRAYAFIKKQVKAGRQIFVICPRIEPAKISKEEDLGGEDKSSPSRLTNVRVSGQALQNFVGQNLGGQAKIEINNWSEVKAVKEEYEKLSREIFPDLKIGMLHGKMKTQEKEETMQKFKQKETDILISTSVIEVGIDIPNATIMMIEGAERFGLAQLHQFRGRVGRAEYQSYCLLFTDSPTKTTQQRLRALITSENGFKLAEKDLQIRGPGDFIGKRQSGIPDLVMSSLKDISLIEKTKKAVKEILTEDPELKKYPLLQKKLEEFEERVHLE